MVFNGGSDLFFGVRLQANHNAPTAVGDVYTLDTVGGTLAMCEAAYGLAMQPAGAGMIVNVTVSPHQGMPAMAHTGAARAAVEALTRELAHKWRDDGVLSDEPEPGYWWLSQDYVGPDGVARTREGLVAALRAEPYENRVVLPHERTHRGPKEGRLRLLRETRAQLEPLFFLYEGPPPAARPERDPDLEVDGARLWRLPENGIEGAFADRQLLIADGHHRYETALAYHQEVGRPESAYVLAVLVSLDDPGLMIFPTHRVFEREPHEELPTEDRLRDPAAALQALEGVPPGRAAAVLYRTGGAELAVNGDELDVSLVDRLGHDGISYTPDWHEAVRAVDSGEAAVAVLGSLDAGQDMSLQRLGSIVRSVAETRASRVALVIDYASRLTVNPQTLEDDETMPQKSTYFYPKLVSGLLFLSLD